MCLHVFFRGKNISFLKLSSHQWNYNHGHFKIQAMLKSPSLNLVGSREFFFCLKWKLEPSCLLWLPIWSCRLEMPSTHGTQQLAQFPSLISDTTYPKPVTSRAMRNSRVFWSGLLVIQGPKTKLYINCFCLWTLLYVTWWVLTFHCLNLIRSPAKRLRIQGLSLSLSCSVEGSHW